MYEQYRTLCVPADCNLKRKMDFPNAASTSFETSLATDTVREVVTEFHCYDADNLYIKAADNTSLPDGNNETIRIQ